MEIKVGDQIWIAGAGGFAPYYGYRTVTKIEDKHDEVSGDKYQLLFVGDDTSYRGDTGACITGAKAYWFDVKMQKK